MYTKYSGTGLNQSGRHAGWGSTSLAAASQRAPISDCVLLSLLPCCLLTSLFNVTLLSDTHLLLATVSDHRRAKMSALLARVTTVSSLIIRFASFVFLRWVAMLLSSQQLRTRLTPRLTDPGPCISSNGDHSLWNLSLDDLSVTRASRGKCNGG